MNDIKDILPSYINNTNFKYLQMDDKFLISIAITDYPSKIAFCELMNSIPKNYLYHMSMFVKKQDTMEILKKLTYSISSFGGEMKSTHENQIDIDILSKVKNDAKELRKEIQINNEQVYQIGIFITFFSYDKVNLIKIIKEFQSKIFSKQLHSNILNFRNLDAYLSTLPFNHIKTSLLNTGTRSITTSTLANFFPFYTTNIFDYHGVIFGYTKQENKLCNLNIFNEKYLNANICIFGASGAGKSYFTKLLIIRHYFNQKIQYIIDPEGEYTTLVSNLKGTVISFNENYYLNLLQFFYCDVIQQDFLNTKITRVVNLIMKLAGIEEEKIKEKLTLLLYNTYQQFGITNDMETLYKNSSANILYVDKELKTEELYPTLQDVYDNAKDTQIKRLLSKVIKKYPLLTKHTNIDLNNSLICFDVSQINVLEGNIFLMEILDYLILNTKIAKHHTIIYIDEVWKYMNLNSDHSLSQKIFSMYKTIRKNNASIVTITQDISDLFTIEGGNYGKSILNNAGFKLFFKLDFSDVEILSKLSILDKEMINAIMTLNKQEALLGFQNNTIVMHIKSNAFENTLITEEINEDNCCITK